MVVISVPQNPAWALDATPHDENRHRSGDTWLIGGKPHDPLDPGPWMWNPAPDFQPDRRTGRHRRGELPDPIRKDRRDPRIRLERVHRPSPHRAGDVRTLPPIDPFARLREDAWARFLDHSTELAVAHNGREKPSRARRFFKRLLALLTG